MKRALIFLLILVLSVISNNSQSQEWNSFLPKDKVENNTLSFYDIQNAFNEYCKSKNIVDGYYYENNEKIKVGGWKQFKRWEWYWENRVNPVTGAFPNTSAYEELQKIKKITDGQKSPSGQWTTMGPSTSPGGYAGLGRLNCIAFHPTDNNIMYVGAAAGGVWKTTDGGSTWNPKGDYVDAIGVSDIIVLPTAGDDVVFLASGDRDHSDTYSVGVLKSTDGGNTWQNTGLIFTAGQKNMVNRLLVDPISNNIFYAATSVGLYKSTDSCNTWNVISSEVFIDMEFKPGASNIIFGSTKEGDIFRSIDSGANWTATLTTSGKRTEIAVSSNNSNIVYAVIANSGSGLFGVYKSTDAGSNFSQTYNSANLLGWNCNGSGSGGQGWYDLCIAADPNNENTVFLGGVNTWKSTDGGYNWDINTHWSGTCGGSASTVHADKHNLTFQNGSSTLFECNDGGLYKTTDNGSNWTHLSDGMYISQMYCLGVAQTTPTDVITGLQDNGTKAMLSSVWNDVIGGDGMECLIDYSDENTQYGSLYYGSIYRTTNHWNSSTNISGGISGNAAWVTPYIQDPNNSNTLFVGYQDVWTSTNQGNSWTKISNWNGSTLRSIAVAPSNSDYIYTATTTIIYATSNAGTNWTNVTGTLPVSSSNITYISVKNDDPNTIWVSMGEFNNYGVFESTDGGTTWTDISNGLPSLPVNCVIQNRQNTSQIELYAATDVGVYLKLGNTDWIPFYTDMPNVVVCELDIYYDDVIPVNSKIRAATFGRGLWESDLYSNATTLSAYFYADTTNIEIGESVIFTDTSSGTPTTWEWTFEEGSPATFTGQTPPAITYDSAGTWDVSLSISDGTNSDLLTKTDYITVVDNSPEADFSADILYGYPPLSTNFTDLSIGIIDTWNWDFGDGNTSTEQNPSHTYEIAEIYTVSLTVSGSSGSDTETKTDYITVNYITPTADFEGDPTTGIIPLEVTFTDLSIDSVNAWSWDFGDGGNSTIQNPVYTYEDAGTYTVTLIVTGPGGSDTQTKTDYIITSEAAPVADFTGSPTSGSAPLLVNFSDLSTGNIDTWDWDFGDGGSSSDKNPEHEYLSVGNFTVSLTVTGAGGNSTETKTDYILIPVGINEINSEALVVYPNPASDKLNIVFPDIKNRELTLKDMSGKQVLQYIAKSKKEIINLQELPQGIYSLTIKTDNKIINIIKIVKK